MLAARTEVAWEFLLELERAMRAAVPESGCHVIAAMEVHHDAVRTLTQNLDRLHRRAGSRRVIDAHDDSQVLDGTRRDRANSVPGDAGLDVPRPRPRVP